MIGNSRYVGAPILRRGDAHGEATYLPLVRKDIDLDGLVTLAAAEKKLGIDFGPYGPDPESGSYERPPVSTLNPTSPVPTGVFIPRPMSAEVFLVDNFEVLASLMYLKHARKAYGDKEKIEPVVNELDKVLSGNRRLVDLQNWSEKQCYECQGLTESSVVTALRVAVFKVNNKTCEMKEHEVANFEKLTSDDTKHEVMRDKLREILLRRYNRQDRQAFREWREIRTILRGSRYSLTVLLACAERVALEADNVIDSASAAETLIRSTVDKVSTLDASSRELAVIGHVIETYGAVHDRSMPQRNAELLQLILRHLAVIGTPTSLDVLVRVPEIRRYFENNRHETHRPRTTELFESMTALVLRGLIYRVEPHPRLNRLKGQSDEISKSRLKKMFGAREPELEARYALHRLTQTYMLRKMGAESVEFGENNAYSPSLYASMSSQLPRLKYESYTFLEKLVSNLSQYPDAIQKRHLDAGGEVSAIEALDQNGWVFHHAPEVTRVQALRAALSIVRATFSVAVVSRFDDYGKENAMTGERRGAGYFEAYRIQIRWLIRKAWELLLEKDDPKFDHLDYQPDRDDGFHQLNACYRDEIVWLYNECGVVSLVQGHVLNAVSLFRQAIRLNAASECDQPETPIYNRIALNLAIAQIDRGRLSSAYKQLIGIRKSEDKNGANRREVWLLATGYLGLVEFLQGRDNDAATCFRKAIKGLAKFSELRASAVFARHWGDLLSSRGDHKGAIAKMTESLGYSETGGHEDIHRKTQLAIIKVERKYRLQKDANQVGLKDELSRIAKVQAYADAMEMPTLSCEAKSLRARLLLDQGETVMSGQLLISAMSEANNNDLQMRLNNAMTDYAELLILRNDPRQAERMLHFSLALAKRHRNRVAIHRIEQLFHRLDLPLPDRPTS